MKKLLTGTMGVLMAFSLVACNQEGGGGSGGDTGGGDASGGRVSLIAKANSSEYWVKVKDGAMAAGKELGVEVSFNGPDTESEGDKQLNQLESAINEKPLGVGFAPQDGAQDGAPRLMDLAKDSDLPVVIFDTALNSSDYPMATVASDSKAIGAQAAEKMVEMIGGKGKVAILAHGEIGTAGERRDGFKEYIAEKAPEVQIVDTQNGESDPAKSRDKAQGILQAHPDLAGFYGTDDDSSIAIADEVKAKGMDVKVVGVDSSPDQMTLLKDGSIHGLVVQDPYTMGYQTVEILVKASKGEQPTEKNVVAEAVWVTKDNLDDPEVKKVTE